MKYYTVPTCIGFSSLCNKEGKIPVYRQTYARILHIVEQFLTQKIKLMPNLETEHQHLGTHVFFLVVVHAFRSFGARLSVEELKDRFLALKKEMSQHLDVETCNRELKWFYLIVL